MSQQREASCMVQPSAFGGQVFFGETDLQQAQSYTLLMQQQQQQYTQGVCWQNCSCIAI